MNNILELFQSTRFSLLARGLSLNYLMCLSNLGYRESTRGGADELIQTQILSTFSLRLLIEKIPWGTRWGLNVGHPPFYELIVLI